MSALSTELRNKLERTCIAARNLAERAAKDALQSLAVAHHETYGHMTAEQISLRNKLRARARQLGDTRDAKGQHTINHLAQECAYEHWHRMLFARFLAENNLLIEPDMGVAVSLDECKELAKGAKTNLWTLAGRYAQIMLPEIFRADDAVLQVPLAREDELKLEQLLDGLAQDTFTAGDSLGWCYQFWQAERKEEVNKAGNKIGADELPSVTQLFTEDYMVDFLLDNTLGAWHAGKVLAANPKLTENAKSEEELRKAVALPGCPWKYLRFIKDKNDKWTPAAGTFDGWPKTAKELKCLDPCMGSGHFVVAMFERLMPLRMAEEKLNEAAAVAMVIHDNLFGLEIDPRCTQIGAFNLALAAWRRVGYRPLPAMNLACSGLAPNTREADWLKVAGDNDKLRRGMERLYRLFKDAPVLGSLINPRAGEGDLLEAGFHELQPLLEKALAQETKDDTVHEMAVTAQGITKAAEILAGQFTLVATNVPYLGRGKQNGVLQDYCEHAHPNAKADLAACFVQRCQSFCGSGASNALVTPQTWLFQGRYESLRRRTLEKLECNIVTKLGPRAFETIGGEIVNVALLIFSQQAPSAEHRVSGIDVSSERSATEKARELFRTEITLVPQIDLLNAPKSRITLSDFDELERLDGFATAFHGQAVGDNPSYNRSFWEIESLRNGWVAYQCQPDMPSPYGGRHSALLWEDENGRMAELANSVRHLNHKAQQWRSGKPNWGKHGIAVSLVGKIYATLYSGEIYAQSCCVIIPNDPNHLSAIWCFASSGQLELSLRKIDSSLGVSVKTVLSVSFDLGHWQNVAEEEYPHGLPKPFSSDPTQWLFNGHPKDSDKPLHVAVARLLGYRWPRQTGSSFPDCPALGLDGLEKMADDDGIVCLPSVRGEEPAAERLRKFLAAALGKDWKVQTELELIRASGSGAADLEEWLQNDFFAQHYDLFHQRPFVWHVWDGRKRDGFHALLNYHTLSGEDGKGRRMLESLTHSYLGDWITRQKDCLKRGEEGADERLAAALALKGKLEAVIEGAPPYDIFVRWKTMSQQAIGWNPDINDGVSLNIRPFAAADILRKKVKIKWDKDRGKEPKRDKADYPWFYNGNAFTGDRLNDVHLTKEQKEKARKS